jgi:hypothetical protein
MLVCETGIAHKNEPNHKTTLPKMPFGQIRELLKLAIQTRIPETMATIPVEKPTVIVLYEPSRSNATDKIKSLLMM